MMFSQVAVALLAVVGCAVATGYGSGGGGYGGGSSYGGGSPSGSGGATFGSASSGGDGAPKPYAFDYNAADEQGNAHYRNEQGDQNGNVKGTYGYNDVQGLYRIVEYVADENGFRATIRTNEPGVDGKESPADVVLTAEQPPSGLQGAATSYGGATSGAGKPPASSYGGGPSGGSKPASGKSGY